MTDTKTPALDIKSKHEADELATLMLNSIPLACQLWDKNYQIIDCNDAAVKLYGFAAKSDYLERFPEIIAPVQADGSNSKEKAAYYFKKAFEEGYVSFDWLNRTVDDEPLPLSITLARVVYHGDFIIAEYAQDMRRHLTMMTEIEYRDNLLYAVNQASAILLNCDMDTFEEAIMESIKLMALAVNVDRMYIFRNFSEAGMLFCTQLYEWAENVEAQHGKEATIMMPYHGNITRWEEILKSGMSISGNVSDFPLEEQVLMRSQDIISILVEPIFINEELWGFIGFDMCHRERVFTEEEESYLRSGGLLFANAWLRNRMIRDIKNTSHELELALDQATVSSKAKGDFVSSMSHEMRTPLNAIIGMTSIGRKANSIEQKNHALHKIEDASSHLLGVINDVLDMAKIEANKLELSTEEFCLEQMLRKVLSVVGFRMREKEHTFSIDIDHQLPQFFVGDDQRLAQVITNLLSNASKFTDKKGRISFRVMKADEQDGIYTLRFEIEDNGIGIAPEQHDRLFQAFSQAESGISRTYGGTGLGLALCKRIVELMGGEIWLESEIDIGSKFIFTIKAKRSNLSLESLLHTKVSKRSLRVLAVDDDVTVRKHIKLILDSIAINCHTAPGGREALDMIRVNGDYDIYLIDWRMPEMDGIELTQQIIKDNAEAFLVLISADWTVDEVETLEVRIDKFLSKPLFSSDIVDCINEFIESDGSHTDQFTAAVASGRFRGKKLLLAEDIELNIEIIFALLEDTGIEIDVASNGKKAYEMVKNDVNRYQMIFMDVHMPVMDGLEATRRIRNLPSETAKTLPIVAMTAEVFTDDVHACFAAGMNDHLGKPLDVKQVFAKLLTYLL
ncbi:MAG: response regulator [Lachnospiraceae bacterium]|nr:response regulator [Lachnospiraceae bacterium]